MISKICFLIAVILFVILAIDNKTAHPTFLPWGLAFIAAGLLFWGWFDYPWPSWPRRGPE